MHYRFADSIPMSDSNSSQIAPRPTHLRNPPAKNISPLHLEKPQQIRMSSPKTTQTFARQQHAHGMLVRSSLLSLKQIEKAPETTGLSLFGASNHVQMLCLEYFSHNPFGMNILQTKLPRKLMILKDLSAGNRGGTPMG
jgi:hypothetical protein